MEAAEECTVDNHAGSELSYGRVHALRVANAARAASPGVYHCGDDSDSRGFLCLWGTAFGRCRGRGRSSTDWGVDRPTRDAAATIAEIENGGFDSYP